MSDSNRRFLSRVLSSRLVKTPQATPTRSRFKKARFEPLEHRRLLATTYYVDGAGGDGLGGSDLNNGLSLNSAFATVQKAADAAQPGDVVEVRGGVYREEVTAPRSGTSSLPITFRAYNNENVVISGGDLVTGWTTAPSVGPNVWQAAVDWDANNSRENNTLFVDGELRFEAKQFAENHLLDIDDWGQIDRGDVQNSSFQSDQLISGSWSSSQWVGARVRHHVTG